MRPLLLGLLVASGVSFGQLFPATASRIVGGNGAPASANCNTAGAVGKVYARKDAATANSTFYVCANTAASTYAWELIGGGSGGSGTVTVVGSGSLTNTALVTGGGTTTLQTAAPTATMDALGNISTPGTLSSGVGSGVAGAVDMAAGTAPSVAASVFGWGAPTTMTTSVRLVSPNAVPAANQVMLFGAPTSNVATWAWTGISGTGSFCMTTSCSMTTPALGTPSALVLTNATALPLTGLASQAADTVVMNASGSSAAPTAKAMPTTGTTGCAGTTDALTYNTTTHALGCNQISGSSSLLDATVLNVADDFLGGFSTTSSSIGGDASSMVFGGCGAGINMGELHVAGRPGIVHIGTAATTGACSSILKSANTVPLTNLPSLANWELRWIVRTEATTSVRDWVGIMDEFDASPANFIGISVDTGLSETAYMFAVCASGTCTRTASSVSLEGTNYHVFRVWSSTAGTINFSIDGGTTFCYNSGGTGGCTASANIPTADIQIGANVVALANTATYIDLDRYAFQMTGLSR